MITFRPLTQWPREETKDRKRGQFRVARIQLMDHLDAELEKIGARNLVIQAGFSEGDLRIDGTPRANCKGPSHPGVVVSFDSDKGPLMFACDTYLEWEDNLRAIALTLEHLRAVERYGATKHGEQYRGYTAIPASHDSSGFRSADEAARFLLQAAGFAGEDPSNVIHNRNGIRDMVYKKAAGSLHPDRGGSHDQFVKVQQAKALLEAA